MRRVNRACAQQYLARCQYRTGSVGGRYVDAGGTARLDANAGDGGPGEQGEIRTLEGRHQECAGAGIASPAMNRALAKSVTFRIKAGEIIASWIAADRCKG